MNFRIVELDKHLPNGSVVHQIRRSGKYVLEPCSYDQARRRVYASLQDSDTVTESHAMNTTSVCTGKEFKAVHELAADWAEAANELRKESGNG